MKKVRVVVILIFLTIIYSMKKPERNINQEIYQFSILEAGSIQPRGWIEEQLRRDLEQGYIGVYDVVHPTVTHDVFINQDRRSRRRIGLRKEWWSGEHEGYWKDAVVRMAFLTHNKEYVAKSESWMNDLKKVTKDADYIGIYADCEKSGCRFNHVRGNGELWVTSRILMAMLAYYEFTDDKEVLDAAERATWLVMKHYKDENYFSVEERGGGISHGVGFFENLEWLYRITGNREYLEFSKKLYNDFNNGNMRDDDLTTHKLMEKDELLEGHGAHIAEGMFVPEYIATIQPEEKYIKAADYAIEKLTAHLTPGGAMRCDEWIKGRKGTADERYEYCGIAEMISPLNKMIAFSGNFDLADKIEVMTFNAGQGARFPVLSALSYLTSDNRIHIKHRELIKREHYDAAHLAAACCALNGGRLMPYYVEGMWMKKSGGDGIAALLFGPSEVKTTINNTAVEIKEETAYPFSDEITFMITPLKPVKFSLMIRKPYECKVYDLDVPSQAKVNETEKYISVEKTWESGDKVSIKFNFEIEQITQPKSKTVKNEGAYFKRGPLVYALPFDHKKKTIKEYNNSGFYRYKVTAQDSAGWKFKLDPTEEFEYVPAETENILQPWDKPVVKLKGTLKTKKNETREVELVPMGTTVFRRVTFPKVKHK